MSQWVDPEVPPPSYQNDGRGAETTVTVNQSVTLVEVMPVNGGGGTVVHHDNSESTELGVCLGCLCAACCCGCVVM